MDCWRLGPWFMVHWRLSQPWTTQRRRQEAARARWHTHWSLGPDFSQARSSSVRVGHGEGRMAKPAWRSPGLERRLDGRAMTTNRRWQRSSKVVMLELGEEGRRARMGVVRTGRGPQPFIGAEGRFRRQGGFNDQP
jgi:hypothetical protein